MSSSFTSFEQPNDGDFTPTGEQSVGQHIPAADPVDVDGLWPAPTTDRPVPVVQISPPATARSRANRIDWYARRILRSALVHTATDDPVRAASVIRLATERVDILPAHHRPIIAYAAQVVEATGLAPTAEEVRQWFKQSGITNGMAGLIDLILSEAMQTDAPTDPVPVGLPPTGVAACLAGLAVEREWLGVDALAVALSGSHLGTLTTAEYRDGKRITTTLTSAVQVVEWAAGQLTALKAACGRTTALRLLTREQLRDLPPVGWIVGDMIPAAAVVELYGPPGGKKTFAAIDLAAAVVSGQAWLERFPVGQRGPVVYWLGEGIEDIDRRISAWEAARGWNTHQRANIGHLTGLHIVRPGQPLHLGDPGVVDILAGTVRSVGAHLLILDTRARATVGLEENSATDMGRVVDHLTRVKDATGCTVLLIHHTGRAGQGSRGSNAIDGALDVSLKLAPDDKGRTWLTVKKNRYGRDGQAYPVREEAAGGSLTLSSAMGHETHTVVIGGLKLRTADVEVLHSLLSGPTGPRQIKRDGFSGSLSVVHRAIQRLVDRAAVERLHGGKYQLTPTGHGLATSVLRQQVEADADEADGRV